MGPEGGLGGSRGAPVCPEGALVGPEPNNFGLFLIIRSAIHCHDRDSNPGCPHSKLGEYHCTISTSQVPKVWS